MTIRVVHDCDEADADRTAAGALHALGLVALAAGDAAHAVSLLEQAACAAGGRTGDDAVARGLPPDLVEALGRLGDAPALRVLAAELRERAHRAGPPAARGWAAHAEALAAAAEGDAERALRALGEALRRATADRDTFELGRLFVTLGQSERRLRRKQAARSALELAVRLFTSCRADAWAVRARAELARAGAPRAVGDQLTVTERRASELAAAGASNSEIAAELYISRRTVEVNLARSYSKLGIRNRAQLGAALASQSDEAQPAAADAGDAVRSALALLHPRRRSEPAIFSRWPIAS
jgi:DNA-binding CsgD family transcriptional regulator